MPDPEALCVFSDSVHRHEDIGLVHTGDRHESVCLAQTLFPKEFTVGAVTHDDHGTGQPLAHLHAAFFAPVNDFHTHPHLHQFFRQIVADLACTYHHDGRCLFTE